jgi:hypothetical protein
MMRSFTTRSDVNARAFAAKSASRQQQPDTPELIRSRNECQWKDIALIKEGLEDEVYLRRFGVG